MNKSKETIEDILKDAAENGDTQKLLGLLEKGAPFVVDMVHYYLNYLYFKIQTLLCINYLYSKHLHSNNPET